MNLNNLQLLNNFQPNIYKEIHVLTWTNAYHIRCLKVNDLQHFPLISNLLKGVIRLFHLYMIIVKENVVGVRISVYK